MSNIIIPSISAQTASIPLVDSFLVSPPIIYHSVASQINAESGSSFENGRYHKDTGEIHGNYEAQYINNKLSGGDRNWTAVTTNFRDDHISGWTKKYLITMVDGSSGVLFDLYDTIQNPNLSWDSGAGTGGTSGLSQFKGISNSLCIIHREVVPVAANAVDQRDKTQTYMYLELSYNNPTNYRIVMEYGQPISLQYTDTYVTHGVWQTVSVARDAGNLEHFLEQNGQQLDFTILPDLKNSTLSINFGYGQYILRHAIPDKPGLAIKLPEYEQFHLYGRNCQIRLEVHPLKFLDLTIKKAPVQIHSNDTFSVDMTKAQAHVNVLGDSNDTQSNDVFINSNNNGEVSFDLTATSNGEPSKITDVLIYIPPQWANIDLGGNNPYVSLPVIKYQESQILNDATRIFSTTGRIMIDNTDHRFSGSFGNYSLIINASNGINWGQRLRGIVGADDNGLSFTRQDPFNVVQANFYDFWVKMDVPLGQEIILDGLCIYTAVRLLAQLGNISPNFLTSIPDTGFPPYDDFFPYYILGKGAGNNPKYRFYPDRTVKSVLLELITDLGEPIFGSSSTVPFYMGFDAYGNFFFAPYDPRQYPVKRYFGIGGKGLESIEHISVYNSVSQLRTEINLQGQDVWTFELLQYHINLNQNIGLIGWRFPWLERSGRYSSEAYIKQIANVAAVQASLPTQIVRFSTIFDPSLFAGDVIVIADNDLLGGAGLYNIIGIESDLSVVHPYYGGQLSCNSTITARSLINSVPF